MRISLNSCLHREYEIFNTRDVKLFTTAYLTQAGHSKMMEMTNCFPFPMPNSSYSTRNLTFYC